MLTKQLYHPSKAELCSAITANTYGLTFPKGVQRMDNANGCFNTFVYQDQSLLLQAHNGYCKTDYSGCIKQEHYIKFLFRLSGKSTTIFDGFGQHELDRPQVMITAGPPEMVKIDRVNGGVQNSHISVCVYRDFFTTRMGIEPDALPALIRKIVVAEEIPFVVNSVPLTTHLTGAAQGMLTASLSATNLPEAYYPSKAIELLCLLFGQMGYDHQKLSGSQPIMLPSKRRRLIDVRDYVAEHYADPITLDELANQVGLSKTVMTAGFLSLFGLSVFDYIHKERMSHAYKLLRMHEQTIAQIAEAVGYQHACNFSTAFQRFFGVPPKAVYGSGREYLAMPPIVHY